MSELTLETAKQVVDQGIAYNAWAWDDPSAATDEAFLEAAKNLVNVATQASANDSVAEAVMAVLHAAQVEPQSELSKQAYAKYLSERGAAPAPATTNGHGVEPTPPAPSEQPVDPTSTASSSTAPAPDLSEIFPNYDDLKVGQITAAILESASSGDLSPEEWEKIKAYESATEERKSILKLEPEFKVPDPEPVPESVTPSSAGAFTTSGGVSTGFVSDSNSDGDSVADFYNGESPSRAQQENLPLPAKVDTSQTPPILPVDITTTGDQDLSRIATQFHSAFAYTQWLQSQEEGRERAAEHLEREAERDAYVSAYEAHKSEIPEEKRTQPTALEAARKAAEKDAEISQHVRDYRARKVRHGIEARELKALATGFDKAVWRINEELDRRARLSTSRPS
jgi:hypothetical protein